MYVKNTQRSWSYCSVGCLIKRSCVKVSRQAHLWRRHQHRRCLCNPQDLESCGKTSKELHQKQAYIWGIPKNTTTLETRLANPGVRTRNGLLFEWNISTEESKKLRRKLEIQEFSTSAFHRLNYIFTSKMPYQAVLTPYICYSYSYGTFDCSRDLMRSNPWELCNTNHILLQTIMVVGYEDYLLAKVLLVSLSELPSFVY